MVGLFRHPTTITMNKTVIQYRNNTISNYHDHTHDHVHLHGLGDWASLPIVVIVMVGVVIAVVAVACLVSYRKVIILGTEKYGGPEVGGLTLIVKLVHLVFHYRCGRGSTATCNRSLGSDSRTVPLRWRGSDKRGGGQKLEARVQTSTTVLGIYKQFWITCHWKTHLDYNHFLNTRTDFYKNYCILQW